ncbi:histone-lysine N-methyltransferase SETMAR [Trichonephila clavipes]|nr:histone-lysine N-methyltransferase SETMAR [Trichonephila clavipes]
MGATIASVLQPGALRCKNAVQAKNKLANVYGDDVLTVSQCQNWLAKFRSGNFDVEDASRSGRPLEVDKDTIMAFFDANRRITTRDIAERMEGSNVIFHNTVFGFVASGSTSSDEKGKEYCGVIQAAER